jgi:hypothetical protein
MRRPIAIASLIAAGLDLPLIQRPALEVSHGLAGRCKDQVHDYPLTFPQPSAPNLTALDGPCDPGNPSAPESVGGADSHGRMDHPKELTIEG